MPIAQSKITAQGQVSVPSEVRRKLGLSPGSVLEWNEEGAKIVVRRAGRYSSQEMHEAVFGKQAPKPHPLAELKRGVRKFIKAKYARG